MGRVLGGVVGVGGRTGPGVMGGSRAPLAPQGARRGDAAAGDTSVRCGQSVPEGDGGHHVRC